MARRVTGSYQRTVAGGEAVDAFIPAPLPPTSPPLALGGKLAERLRLAEQALAQLLANLERYIRSDDDLPTLVRAGLVHVQFEIIYPHLDGNGRLGRLLKRARSPRQRPPARR